MALALILEEVISGCSFDIFFSYISIFSALSGTDSVK
jgi:hypothetical protein